MPRTARATPAGYAYHVINRGVGGMRLFAGQNDYDAFLNILAETIDLYPLRICAFCVMPNHWHFIVWPERDGQVGAFFQRLTVTHAMRWQRFHNRVGLGHVYQGRFKSFPIQHDEHFYHVARYAERNALRANLVNAAENWRWSSLRVRTSGSDKERACLADWPLPIPPNWLAYVNRAETEAELAALRRSVVRSCPYGARDWVRTTARELGLESTLRSPGRP